MGESKSQFGAGTSWTTRHRPGTGNGGDLVKEGVWRCGDFHQGIWWKSHATADRATNLRYEGESAAANGSLLLSREHCVTETIGNLIQPRKYIDKRRIIGRWRRGCSSLTARLATSCHRLLEHIAHVASVLSVSELRQPHRSEYSTWKE